MTIISSKDLQVLANYNFSTKNTPSNAKTLLGLKWIKDNGKWTQQVIELNKQDVTCWALFLSFMRIGKLAYTTVSLNKICTYLSKYEWKNLTTPDPQQTNAYGTVCLLAARQLSKRKVDLFKKVAQPFITPCGFKHYWHLGLNGRFLLEQYKYQLPEAKGIEIRFKDTQMPVTADQSLSQQDLNNIEVGFQYELIKKTKGNSRDESYETYHNYHYASEPFYQKITNIFKLPQRQYLSTIPDPNPVISLPSSDLNILSDYNFLNGQSNKQNPYLLGLKCIKLKGQWSPQLCKISRQDLTYWTRFISFFRRGKLAHTTVSLKEISRYLSGYQWKQIKQDQNQTKAFETVCHIANRQLKHREIDLFKQVSDLVPNNFQHYWNPAMQTRFLLDLHKYQLPQASHVEVRVKNENLSSHQKLTQSDLLTKVEVGYNHEIIREGEDYHYFYPTSPYYQTKEDRIMKRRRKL